jgi:hypothetical protein
MHQVVASVLVLARFGGLNRSRTAETKRRKFQVFREGR